MLKATFTTVPQFFSFSKYLKRTTQSNHSSSLCSLSNHYHRTCFTHFILLQFPLLQPSPTFILFCQQFKFLHPLSFGYTRLETPDLKSIQISIIFIPTLRLLSIIVEIASPGRTLSLYVYSLFLWTQLEPQYHPGSYYDILIVSTFPLPAMTISNFLHSSPTSRLLDSLTFCRWSCLQINRVNKGNQVEIPSASWVYTHPYFSCNSKEESFPSNLFLSLCSGSCHSFIQAVGV